jgi:hypothetical protein
MRHPELFIEQLLNPLVPLHDHSLGHVLLTLAFPSIQKFQRRNHLILASK